MTMTSSSNAPAAADAGADVEVATPSSVSPLLTSAPFGRSTRPVYNREVADMADIAMTDATNNANGSAPNNANNNATTVTTTSPRKYRRFKATIAYDGTSYSGFQTQSNGNGIQDILETRLSSLFDARVHVAASGRTDAGVHARGQVIHFDLPRSAEECGSRAAGHLKRALSDSSKSDDDIANILEQTLAADAWRGNGSRRNGRNSKLPDHDNLPPDIQILSVAAIPSGSHFHARESCVGKRYVYTIQEGSGTPLTSRYRWNLGRTKRLNVGSMNDAAHRLLGEHDFTTFGLMEEGDTRPTRKRMRRLEVSRIVTIDPIEAASAGCINTDAARCDTVVTIVAECDRYLYNMMRMICGTLVQVGLGRLTPDDVTTLLERRGRTGGREATKGLEVTKAPAHGLCLHHCFYEPEETDESWMEGGVAGTCSNADDVQAALALLQL